MDHYLDIQLLSDPEFPKPILMNALYAKMHRALVELQSSGIGVSFPSFGEHDLGDRLRLHGTSTDLEHLMGLPWLKGMNDHIDEVNLKHVPDKTGHCRVQRVQTKSSAERLRRRYQKRHPQTSEARLNQLIPDSVEHRLGLPYVLLKSQSTGQRFPLFIRQEEVSQPSGGTFNSFGLSRSATVPLF